MNLEKIISQATIKNMTDNISDFQTKKEKLKETAKKSLIFSVSNESYKDFCDAVDLIKENEEGLDSLNYLYGIFLEEKKVVADKLEEVLA